MYLSITFLIGLYLLNFSLSAFSIAIATLKSHRVFERLHSLSNLFFYLGLHQRIFGLELSRLKLCLTVSRTFLRYTLIAYVFIFLRSYSFLTSFSDGIFQISDICYIAAILFICLVLTDTIPRLLAAKWPLWILKFTSPFVSIVCSLLVWIVLPIIRLTEWHEESDESRALDPTFEVREKMMEMLHDFEASHPVDLQNRSLLNGFIKYQDRIVREIMVPRVEIFCLSATTSINVAAEKIMQQGYTRIPIFEDNIDNILGVVMAKDLLRVYLEAQELPDAHLAPSKTLASLVKPVLFTPENKRVSTLLQDFRKRHVHLAIVVDEYGGTEGLVTIEDILEEIVGDIEDEYDLKEKNFTLLSDGSYILDAHINIFDLNENLNINIPCNGDYDTLSGYIFSKVGTIPSKGLVIHQNDFELEVIECSERSVEKVRFRLHDKA
jgi:putative hemolysin